MVLHFPLNILNNELIVNQHCRSYLSLPVIIEYSWLTITWNRVSRMGHWPHLHYCKTWHFIDLDLHPAEPLVTI